MAIKKRGLKWNKKADDVLMNQIVFIIILVIFIFMVLFFVRRAGNQASLSEQIYAKQIALMIDKAKPGTEITLDISKLYFIAEENNFMADIINIDNSNRKVSVFLMKGKGYNYVFFNDKDVVWNIDKKEKKLFIKVV